MDPGVGLDSGLVDVPNLDPSKLPNRPKQPVISDVARRAQVSVATVSRALGDKGRVAESTRRRVREAAAELGYVIDPHASRLRSGRHRTIGLVAPGLHWYLSRVVLGVERVLHGADYDLSLVAIETPKRRSDFLDAVNNFARRVDGLLLVDFPPPAGHDRLDELDKPMVHVGSAVIGHSSITITNQRAACDAVTHLIERGHRRIGFIGVAVAEAGSVPVSAQLRLAGYLDALHRAGIEPDPRWQRLGAWSPDSGQRAMRDLLEADPSITAVFACSDELALGAWTELLNRHLSVPDDVSLVGFDDHDLAEVFGLTTMAQSVDKLGERAAGLLLDLIDEPRRPPSAEEWDVNLVVRSSTRAIEV